MGEWKTRFDFDFDVWVFSNGQRHYESAYEEHAQWLADRLNAADRAEAEVQLMHDGYARQQARAAGFKERAEKAEAEVSRLKFDLEHGPSEIRGYDLEEMNEHALRKMIASFAVRAEKAEAEVKHWEDKEVTRASRCDEHEQELKAEVARLTACLAKANAGFEEHERKFYLEREHAGKAEAELARLRGEHDDLRDVKGHFQEMWIARGQEIEKLQVEVEELNGALEMQRGTIKNYCDSENAMRDELACVQAQAAALRGALAKVENVLDHMVCEDVLDNEHHNNAVDAVEIAREALALGAGSETCCERYERETGANAGDCPADHAPDAGKDLLAQLAAMRAALERVLETTQDPEKGAYHEQALLARRDAVAALATDAGRGDFLDEVVEERASKNPGFPGMVDRAEQRALVVRVIEACAEYCEWQHEADSISALDPDSFLKEEK